MGSTFLSGIYDDFKYQHSFIYSITNKLFL